MYSFFCLCGRWEKQHTFIPAEPRRNSKLFGPVTDQSGKEYKNMISCYMAFCIIETFKVIYITDKESTLLTIGESLFIETDSFFAIVEAGQGIIVSCFTRARLSEISVIILIMASRPSSVTIFLPMSLTQVSFPPLPTIRYSISYSFPFKNC